MQQGSQGEFAAAMECKPENSATSEADNDAPQQMVRCGSKSSIAATWGREFKLLGVIRSGSGHVFT